MRNDEFDLATPVLSDLESADPDGLDADAIERSELGGGRQLRHVLIPSELVRAVFTLPDGAVRAIQADLINVSGGGCCLVLPCRLPLQIGDRGEMQRPGEIPGHLEQRPFVVRWLQELGEMLQIGTQYIES